MLNQTFIHIPSKEVSYRSYRNFSMEAFKAELRFNLAEKTQPGVFMAVHSALEAAMEKYAPCKKRIIRGNNKPHVSKILRKAIIKRSRLKNIFNRTRNINDYINYKKQRNYVVNLNKQEKRQFFKKVDTNTANSPKEFWAFCKPFFTNKCCSNEIVSLLENDAIVQENSKVADIFNNYFNTITSALNIVQWKPDYVCKDLCDLISKFSDHPSILKIRHSISDVLHFISLISIPGIHIKKL